MSGIAVLLDLLRKNPNFSSTKSLHSFNNFSAKIAVSSATASVLAVYPFGLRAFLGSNNGIAYCDSASTWSEDQNQYFPERLDIPKHDFDPETRIYAGKTYNVDVKPLFSAFYPRSFGLTVLRSFLMNYLPLLEHRPPLENEDDEELFPNEAEKKPLDLVAPFYNSLKQITRECTVITTRRLLEGLAVSYFSQRMAWKLLKDARRSASRKAVRGLPTTTYFCAVTKTSFRAHCLGVAATWVVQIGIDIYRTFYRFYNARDDIVELNKKEELQLLGKKIYIASLKCTASLVFAAIGAGLGATLIHPSIGQWIGCASGDLAGPLIVAFCFDKLILAEA